jgi:hypothetical protein
MAARAHQFALGIVALALLSESLPGGVAPAEACSRVFSSAGANGQAMVVGRTMNLFINDNAALLGKLVSDGLNERGLNANLTRRKPTSTA